MTKQLDQMTEHEKTLLIAKAMFGEENVSVGKRSGRVFCNKTNRIVFNPYQDGNDSQAVQEFFNIATHPTSFDRWEAKQVLNSGSITVSEDLKTAIADCAVLVILEKKNEY